MRRAIDPSVCCGAVFALGQPALTVQNAASFRPGQAAPGSVIGLYGLADPSTASMTILPAGATKPVPFVQGFIALLPDTPLAQNNLTRPAKPADYLTLFKQALGHFALPW